jgi:hypothetical protein
MEKNYTPYFRKYASYVAVAGTLLLSSRLLQAQISCPNARDYGTETFGTGTTATSDPYVVTSVLTYQATGPLTSEGSYRVINNTQQKSEWLASTDHTGNVNGKMLVINGQAESFYQRTIVLPSGFVPGTYNASLFIMNIDSAGLCAPNPLLPILTFTGEYLSQSNTWVPLGGSPFTNVPVPQTASPTWVNQGASFTLPETGSFFPTSIRITINDGTVGGCGNDFALDDMNFSFCPEGGPLPVEFLGVTARQKGSGVQVSWSTAQEINNSYFEVERSADGNTHWDAVAKVDGAGNSQIVKSYSALDASPLSGENYYRIKQVDFDGNAKFSKTVSVTIDGATGVSVLANPFHSQLSVNFRIASAQQVSARLFDITGKQVAAEKWSLTPGTVKKDFSSAGSLQPGMYILSIRNNSGDLLYNGKVLKQ